MRRISVECSRGHGFCVSGIFHLHERGLFHVSAISLIGIDLNLKLLPVLIHYGCSTLFEGGCDESVAVAGVAFHGDEHSAWGDFTRIACDVGDFYSGISVDSCESAFFYNLFQFHFLL